MEADHQLITAVVLWYLCACVAVTSSKQILGTTGLPAFLCLTQNVIGCICCRITAAARSTEFTPIAPQFRALVIKIGFVYALGFWLTNTSISAMSASLAETIKSFEPITSVALAAAFLQETAPSGSKLVGVVMAVVGVVLATQSESTANLAGVSTAALSTICFSLRGLYARQLREATTAGPGSAYDASHVATKPDADSLFYRVCQISTAISLVLLISTEDTSAVLDLLQTPPNNLAKLVVLNGVVYWGYNQASFAVLNQVSLVTHAVFNVCRRLVIVVVSTLWFASGFSSTAIFGLAVAFSGFLLFSEPWASQSRSHTSSEKDEVKV